MNEIYICNGISKWHDGSPVYGWVKTVLRLSHASLTNVDQIQRFAF